MEMRQFRYFVAVARERNFSRAAEILHMAQPPLSRQIQQLEDDLGVILIDRSSRPLVLTEAGRFFYEQAEQMIAKTEHIREQTKRIGHSKRQVFIIGCVASTLYGGIPDLVRRMRQCWPDLDIEIREMMSTEQTVALKEGRIDLGFGRVRFADNEVERFVVREERLVLALPKTHRHASSREEVSLKVMQGETVIIYPSKPRPSYADEILGLLRKHGVIPQFVEEVREIQTALGLVAAGMGVSLVPAASQRQRPDDVVYRLVAEKDATSPIIASYRHADALGRISEIKELIVAMYADKPAWLALSQVSCGFFQSG
jgi:DNA-binding transcriptional LysR family regulator